jgi:hypothetical protein
MCLHIDAWWLLGGGPLCMLAASAGPLAPGSFATQFWSSQDIQAGCASPADTWGTHTFVYYGLTANSGSSSWQQQVKQARSFLIR